MNVSEVWGDTPIPEDVQEGGPKFYYLVYYDTDNGLWHIDDDAIYLPEAPIYDPKIDRWRKMHTDEISRDKEIKRILGAAIRWIKDVA